MANLTVSAANVQNSATAKLVQGDSLEAITAGQLVYRATDGRYGLADANGATPLYKVMGIATNSCAAANQPIEICTSDPDFVIGGTTVVGDSLFSSGTPGAIAPVGDLVTGWYVALVGVVTTITGHIKFSCIRSDAAKV